MRLILYTNYNFDIHENHVLNHKALPKLCSHSVARCKCDLVRFYGQIWPQYRTRRSYKRGARIGFSLTTQDNFQPRPPKGVRGFLFDFFRGKQKEQTTN